MILQELRFINTGLSAVVFDMLRFGSVFVIFLRALRADDFKISFALDKGFRQELTAVIAEFDLAVFSHF